MLFLTTKAVWLVSIPIQFFFPMHIQCNETQTVVCHKINTSVIGHWLKIGNELPVVFDPDTALWVKNAIQGNSGYDRANVTSDAHGQIGKSLKPQPMKANCNLD